MRIAASIRGRVLSSATRASAPSTAVWVLENRHHSRDTRSITALHMRSTCWLGQTITSSLTAPSQTSHA